MKYLAIIPARSRSKRILNKNVRILNNKKLLEWSVISAKNSKLVDNWIVTTDNESIAKCIQSMSEVHMRPKELGKDNVGLTSVLKDVLEKTPADNIILLRPTSPIRYNNIIDKCIKQYERYGADSLCTGFWNKEVPAFTEEDGPSQLKEGWFQNDGCIEIHSKDVILNNKICGEKTIKYEIDDIYHHEIDTWLDFIVVENLMRFINSGNYERNRELEKRKMDSEF